MIVLYLLDLLNAALWALIRRKSIWAASRDVRLKWLDALTRAEFYGR